MLVLQFAVLWTAGTEVVGRYAQCSWSASTGLHICFRFLYELANVDRWYRDLGAARTVVVGSTVQWAGPA